MEGNPTGCMGLADYLGWNWKSKAGLPIVNVPGCPVQPDNFMETLLYLLYQAAGLAPMIPLDDAAAAAMALRQHRSRRLRSRRLLRSRAISPPNTARPMPGQDRLLGTGRQLQRPQTRLDGRHRRLPERRRHLHRLHHARLPRQVHAVHGRAAGASFPRWPSGIYGRIIRSLRRITNTTVNKEPKWRHRRRRLTTGYHPTFITIIDSKFANEGATMSTHDHPDRTARRSNSANLVEMSWDPITRIVGSLGIYTKIDFANRQVAECHSTSSIFRGYSIFMKGKDPRDAHFITSRICGICGDNHATCATYAQNMAFGIKPPAMAEWIVNLGEAAEYMFDHNIFQDNLVGVDFCEQMVKETNPGVWERPKHTARRMRRSRLSKPSPTSCAR